MRFIDEALSSAVSFFSSRCLLCWDLFLTNLNRSFYTRDKQTDDNPLVHKIFRNMQIHCSKVLDQPGGMIEDDNPFDTEAFHTVFQQTAKATKMGKQCWQGTISDAISFRSIWKLVYKSI